MTKITPTDKPKSLPILQYQLGKKEKKYFVSY